MRKTAVALLICIGWISSAQEIKVDGGFLTDSLKIGKPVDFWLTAKYPAKIDLILPDSNFNFSPFEFAARQLFDTRESNGMAMDSVVYSLRSFEIDKVQYLSLPAIVYRKKDTLRVFSSRDSIYFQELVPLATDTTAVKTNTDYQKVSRALNQPLLMIILGLLVLITLTVILVFGKKIRLHFLLKRMAKSHASFQEALGNKIQQLKTAGEPEFAEEALGIWKKYQEKLEKQPFTKLTSKEIVKYPFAQELETPLRSVDRCVYGKLTSANVYQDFQHLQDFSEMRYQSKVEELRHGKN